MVFTTIMLILAMVSTCKTQRKMNLKNNPRAAAFQAKLKRKAFLFFGLLIMVVLGWLSGLVAVLAVGVHTSMYVIAVLVYVVCGYGQGVYLFLFVGVFNRSVRQDWKRLFRSLLHLCSQAVPKTNNTVSDTV